MLNRSKSAMRRRGMRGFSLLEMLISVAVLVAVTTAVFAQIMQMQKKSSSEAAKLDMTQSARDFVEQMVSDLHMAGYPKASMYGTQPNNSQFDNTSMLVAAGLVSVSPTQIQLEGDVNNDGIIESVNIGYVAADPNDPTCPCIRRRVIAKLDRTAPLAQPTGAGYGQVEHVFPPGAGPGGAGEDLFTFFKQDGTQVPVNGGVDISTAAGQNTISGISTVKINLSMLSNIPDPASDGFIRNSITATVKLNQ
jgi:prepilin-type N-terminal cleavage/methylation domain-containing protein